MRREEKKGTPTPMETRPLFEMPEQQPLASRMYDILSQPTSKRQYWRRPTAQEELERTNKLGYDLIACFSIGAFLLFIFAMGNISFLAETGVLPWL